MRDNTLIKYLKLAERIDASDIHIKSGKCAIARVSGTLKQIDDAILTKEQVFSFIQDILTEKQMTEFDLYSDVDSSFSVGDRRFRCNVYRDFNGFSISIRRIINEIGDFRSLGIPEVLKNLAVKKSGLILVTGPTGSGKTTTLASIINYLNRVITAHIITIEDPIEYTYTSNRCVITQREIGRDASDYPRALRASLRQDPDVIMLGEMRDLESIRTALTAAETGHLVLSTLHTTGACNSIDRIIDVFPADQQQQIPRAAFNGASRRSVAAACPQREGRKVACNRGYDLQRRNQKYYPRREKLPTSKHNDDKPQRRYVQHGTVP